METFIVKCPLDKAIDYFSNIENLKDYEPNIKVAKLLEPYGDKSFIYYTKYKSLNPLQKKKDFCIFRSHTKIEDGVWIALGCSVDHASVPTTGKNIRGIMDTIGYVLQQEDSNNTKISCVYQIAQELSDSDFVSGKSASKFKIIRKKLE